MDLIELSLAVISQLDSITINIVVVSDVFFLDVSEVWFNAVGVGVELEKQVILQLGSALRNCGHCTIIDIIL